MGDLLERSAVHTDRYDGIVLLKRPWLAVLIGVLISAAIEVTQLLTHRGLFEFDDIIYNSVGAVVGFLLYLLLKRIGQREVRNE